MQMKTCLPWRSAQCCVKHQKDTNSSETNPSSDTINKHERFDDSDDDGDDDENGIFSNASRNRIKMLAHSNDNNNLKCDFINLMWFCRSKLNSRLFCDSVLVLQQKTTKMW